MAEDDVTGLILVGGQSRRMGQDKAFLNIAGKPLFERVLELFRECFTRVLLVGDRAERFAAYGLPVLPDLHPGSALGGLYSGLCHAETDTVFVSSCDLPYPNKELLRYLCSLREGVDVVVVKTAQGYEPLFALYAKSCLGPMLRLLESGNYRVYDLYPQLNVRYVTGAELKHLDRAENSFVNLNTMEQFHRVRRELEQVDR